jgi:hypothetical protein
LKNAVQIAGFLIGAAMTVVGMLYNWAPFTLPGALLNVYRILSTPVLGYAQVELAWMVPVYINMQMVTWAWLFSIVGIALMAIMFVSVASSSPSRRR